MRSKGINSSTTLSDAISDILQRYGCIDSTENKRFKLGQYSNKNLSNYQKLLRRESGLSPDSHRFASHQESTVTKFETIIREKLTSQEIRKRFKTKKSSTKLLASDLPTPTLTTLPDDFVHYCEPRILTVREYARIQSFPDDYEFKGKYTTGGQLRRLEVPRYTQVGNAIPPLFAEQAGLALHQTLKDG